MKIDLSTYLKEVKKSILYNFGIQTDKIRPFSESIYERLREIIYATLPAIIYIKFERPTEGAGNCRERAYILSAALEGSVVVRSDRVIDSESDFHYWVEKDDVCYDPADLTETEKGLYYKINDVKGPTVISREDLDKTGFIQYCMRRKISDFSTDQSYRSDLEGILPFVLNGVKYKNNQDYRDEIDYYLSRIGYFERDENNLTGVLKK